MQNAECRNCNGEMRQWCGGAWSAVGATGRRVVAGDLRSLGANAGGLVRPACGNMRELREMMGVRFSVDVGSKACGRERDVRDR